MTSDVPFTALTITLWGQDPAVDQAALERLRAGPARLRLVAICIAGAEPPAAVSFDRVIRLPLRLADHFLTLVALSKRTRSPMGTRLYAHLWATESANSSTPICRFPTTTNPA